MFLKFHNFFYQIIISNLCLGLFYDVYCNVDKQIDFLLILFLELDLYNNLSMRSTLSDFVGNFLLIFLFILSPNFLILFIQFIKFYFLIFITILLTFVTGFCLLFILFVISLQIALPTTKPSADFNFPIDFSVIPKPITQFFLGLIFFIFSIIR